MDTEQYSIVASGRLRFALLVHNIIAKEEKRDGIFNGDLTKEYSSDIWLCVFDAEHIPFPEDIWYWIIIKVSRTMRSYVKLSQFPLTTTITTTAKAICAGYTLLKYFIRSLHDCLRFFPKSHPEVSS